jgi:hypothetical protein
MANFSGLTTQRQEILNKWYDSGLLDGLDDSTATKKNYAELMESQASHLVYKMNETPPNSGFDTIAFPMVRRIYARTLFQDLQSHYVEFKKDGLTPYNYVKKHKL